MDEWHVGDPADWGDSVGVPDIGYMGYLQDDEEEEDAPRHITHSEALRNEAWMLRNEGKLDAALSTINEALEYGGHGDSYNIKAIILEDMGDYDSALMHYDMALERIPSQVFRDNKARLLERMVQTRRYPDQQSLDYINLALKLTKNEDDRLGFLATKRDVLESMGRYREAYVSGKLANGQVDLVDEFESQSEIIKKSIDTLVCIAGTRFYDFSSQNLEGMMVDLIKEPENEHDPDSIRVELQGNAVGYVANSQRTLIDEAKSASEIKDMFEYRRKARVMFVFMERYVIAKLI